MFVEEGVMILKNGKAWGIVFRDGKCTAYGWVDIEKSEIHDPRYCKKVTDVTSTGSMYIDELLTGTLTHVRRTVNVEVLEPVNHNGGTQIRTESHEDRIQKALQLLTDIESIHGRSGATISLRSLIEFLSTPN